MIQSINSKRKETIVNEQKMKQIAMKKTVRSIKTTNSAGKLIRQNRILNNGQQKSRTIEFNNKGKSIIETPKYKNPRNTQSVNIQRSQAAIAKTQLSPEQIQLDLFKKKKNLQKQLEKVRIKLNQQFDSKKNSQRIKTQIRHSQQDDEEAFKRVNTFLRRMKKQKIQLMLKKKISHEKQMNLKMQQENLMYEALMIEKQKLKQDKRKSIAKNIQQQKTMAELRKKINKRSNSLIQQLLSNYKTDREQSTQRIQSEVSQEKISGIQSLSQAFRPQRKKFEISPFLSQVLKEQAEKKKYEQLKLMQRKRVQIRHKEYSQKTRAKTKYSIYESTSIK